jgi:hypothetical protein
MTLSINNLSAIEACDAIVDNCDNGTGVAQATLIIYDGTPPALADTALSGNTVLAQLDMSNPAFGNAVDAAPGATATAAAISDDTSADNSGTATFFRIVDRDGTPIIQGSVGTSGAELNLNSVAISAGALVSVTSLTVTMPEG